MTFLEKVKLIVFKNVPPSEILNHEEFQYYKRLKAAQRVQTLKEIDLENLALYTYLLESKYNLALISERAYKSMCETYETDIAHLYKEIEQNKNAKELDDFIRRTSSYCEEEYYD